MSPLTPYELYRRAKKLGLQLAASPSGDVLLVSPEGKCPPEFNTLLRQHEQELLAWLRSRPSGPLPDLDVAEDYFRTFPSTTKPFRPGWTPPESTLPPDQLPWLPIARQVLAGKFDKDMTPSMKESLIIGLRSINHPVCREALLKLKAKP